MTGRRTARKRRCGQRLASPAERPARPRSTEVKERPRCRMPFYVSPEQAMKDKADYARKNIARGRNSIVMQYADGILFVAPNPSQRAAQDQRDLRPDRVRRGRAVQRVREPAQGRRPLRRLQRLPVRQERRHRPRPGQLPTRRRSARSSPRATSRYEVEIVVAEVGDSPRSRPDLPDHLRRLGGRRARLRGLGRPGGPGGRRAQGALRRRHVRCPRRSPPRWRRCPPPGNGDAPTAAQLEVAILDRTRDHRTFRRIRGARLEALLAESRPAAESPAPTRSDASGSGARPPPVRPPAPTASGSASARLRARRLPPPAHRSRPRHSDRGPASGGAAPSHPTPPTGPSPNGRTLTA